MSEDIEKLYEQYREGDTQYQLAGGIEGCRKLADDFYDVMETLPEARKILFMHPNDLEVSRDKLALFLVGYMDGPALFEEKYGPIALGAAHGHLSIGSSERDMWLNCMRKALDMQDWPETFKDFMFMRFHTPASRIQNRP